MNASFLFECSVLVRCDGQTNRGRTGSGEELVVLASHNGRLAQTKCLMLDFRSSSKELFMLLLLFSGWFFASSVHFFLHVCLLSMMFLMLSCLDNNSWLFLRSGMEY